jgi:hypothetical protein
MRVAQATALPPKCRRHAAENRQHVQGFFVFVPGAAEISAMLRISSRREAGSYSGFTWER